MSSKELSALSDMLDRLGSDMWLVLDGPAFERCFGSGDEGLRAARGFASKEGCIFIAETPRSGRFGRAFDKRPAGA